ncbi:MAG TPA: SGNH/GDSL hydrolase family protein [Actinomycetes bacterium]|nr:SGNH/GDSL hydrolase family protein [Actinomycetes bacterium]
MSRASRARAVASAAAVGGAGLVGVGGALYGVLLGQTRLARRRIGEPIAQALNAEGTYGEDDTDLAGQTPISLVVLGDSGAAGFGVDRPEQTTGAVAASGLARALGRPVALRSLAVVGAQSGDLQGQIDRIQEPWPDLALIIVGANDVTHRVPPGRSVAMLTAAINRLRAHDINVVVGTCPDLGTVRPIPHPLRWVARRWSRSLAAAQMVATVESGARAVALADLLGPEFDAHPDRMFGPDRFHPSTEGYRALAEALVPSLADALSGPPTPDAGTTSLELAEAAAEAAEVGGAEVAVDTGSRLRGLLRLRRGGGAGEATPAEASEP